MDDAKPDTRKEERRSFFFLTVSLGLLVAPWSHRSSCITVTV